MESIEKKRTFTNLNKAGWLSLSQPHSSSSFKDPSNSMGRINLTQELSNTNKTIKAKTMALRAMVMAKRKTNNTQRIR